MKAPVVIIGIGQLAGVFARGFLRLGHPVYPITRDMKMARECEKIPEPVLVLVAVPEHELHPVLEQIPRSWRPHVGLLQNELLPGDWQRHGLEKPTVTVVWFEKKKGIEVTDILYTSVFGSNAALIAEALQNQGVSIRFCENEQVLLFELVRKAVYILTVNIAGLRVGGTVGQLWLQHQPLARNVAAEVISIQEWLTGQSLPEKKLIAGMVEAIEDCPDRNCLGRRAFARLQRALEFASKAGLQTPTLMEIYHANKPGVLAG